MHAKGRLSFFLITNQMSPSLADLTLIGLEGHICPSLIKGLE